MADSTTDTQAAPPPAGLTIKGDAYDEGLDLNNLPDAPWTIDALGAELYGKLARVSGTLDPRLEGGWTPALDPRSFAKGRAVRRAGLFNVPLPPEGAEDDALEAWFNGLTPAQQADYNALTNEATALEQALAAKLPPLTGTARAAGAAPLKPTKLQFRKRVF